MKGRWELFTYPVMDIKAAEAMLNRRAEQGWRLEKLWLGLLASFVPAEEPVRYCIDWYDPNREDGLDYRTLLADAGWQPVGQAAYWNLYEAPAGTAPIQTDGELEYRRFRKKSLRRMAIGWGALACLAAAVGLLFAVLSGLAPGKLDWRFALTFLTDLNTGAMLLLLLPLLILECLLWSGRLLLRLGQWRRAIAREEPFPVPGQGSALAARLWVLVSYLILLPLVLAFLLDAMSGELNLGWIVGMAIASLVILGREPRLEFQRRRRYAKGALVCLAVLLALWILPLSAIPRALCVKPPLADGRFVPERTDVEMAETHATFLAARTEWYEGGPLAEGEFAYGQVESQVWALPWPWLADWVTEQYLALMGTPHPEELTGYEDVWLSRASLSSYPYERSEDLWLIRRGNTVLWVETDMGPLDAQWLEEILARLEGEAG